ncbi:hypothetical protein RHSIM_Rhsim08G0176700 [Rhododendron simsii]|uniref:Uncharacterized protein n=1 Tax=Rhododendron simsii TaxID=118357 RepID=A0A834LF22_RHOSS|nr:hypothetical protein RHSIM_Rhsim08G0176700 [Rhododendron simsii]
MGCVPSHNQTNLTTTKRGSREGERERERTETRIDRDDGLHLIAETTEAIEVPFADLVAATGGFIAGNFLGAGGIWKSLQRTTIDACPGLEEIELNAINLITFECRDPSMKKFSFSCVPKLEKMFFSRNLSHAWPGYFVPAASNLPQLKTLRISATAFRSLSSTPAEIERGDASSLNVVMPLPSVLS